MKLLTSNPPKFINKHFFEKKKSVGKASVFAQANSFWGSYDVGTLWEKKVCRTPYRLVLDPGSLHTYDTNRMLQAHFGFCQIY